MIITSTSRPRDFSIKARKEGEKLNRDKIRNIIIKKGSVEMTQ